VSIKLVCCEDCIGAAHRSAAVHYAGALFSGMCHKREGRCLWNLYVVRTALVQPTVLQPCVMLARYSQACPAAIICSSSHWCSGYHVSKNMFASDSNACAPTSFAAERIARRCSAHLCSCSHWCSGKHVSNNMFASDSNACAPTRIAAERTARRCSALFPPCSRQLGCPLCLWRLRNAKHHSF